MRRSPFRDYLSTIVTHEDYETAARSIGRRRNRDIAPWLYEYEIAELAIGRSLLSENADQRFVNIQNFFPEIDFRPPFCDRLPGVPVWVLLPFYNQIIVWLEPFRTPSAFARAYGLAPTVFADLCGDKVGAGKLLPILNAPPTAFAGLKHFERILALRPPTLWRDFFFQLALVGVRAFEQARTEAEAAIPRRLSSRRRFASLRASDRGSVRDFATSCYCQICAFGGAEIAARVVRESASWDVALDRLFYYAVVLYDSYVSPIGGTYPCSREQLRVFAPLAASGATLPNLEEFPVEIGKQLIDQVALPMPVISCAREWWLTEGRRIWKPAREALASLDRALDSASAPEIGRSGSALKDVWMQINAEVTRSRTLKKRMTWALSSVGVLGAAAGLLLPQLPGFIASALSSTVTLNVFDVPRVYARLFRPRHLIAAVELREYLHTHSNLFCP